MEFLCGIRGDVPRPSLLGWPLTLANSFHGGTARQSGPDPQSPVRLARAAEVRQTGEDLPSSALSILVDTGILTTNLVGSAGAVETPR